jgi:hypothetical protein
LEGSRCTRRRAKKARK